MIKSRFSVVSKQKFSARFINARCDQSLRKLHVIFFPKQGWQDGERSHSSAPIPGQNPLTLRKLVPRCDSRYCGCLSIERAEGDNVSQVAAASGRLARQVSCVTKFSWSGESAFGLAR